MRKKINEFIYIVIIILLLPYILTVFIGGNNVIKGGDAVVQYVDVRVGNIVKRVPWEEFFIGILAKEISPEYETEAVCAQAVLIRTNLYRKLQEKEDVIFSESYLTYSDMQKRWGSKKAESYYSRLKKCALLTKNKVILYEGTLRKMSFHALSNGKTRNGREAFGNDDYPYLQSKDCEKDVEAPEQMTTVTMKYEDVKKACRPFLTASDEEHAAKPFTFEDFEIKETDSAGYVTKIRIAHDICSGEEFREALGLESGSFTLQDLGGKLRITVKGVGHGLGMSQYTANEMAKEGKTAEEILEYFFTGIEIKEMTEIL